MSEIETYIHAIKEKHGETAYKQLCLLYQHLQQTLPEATECISYGMQWLINIELYRTFGCFIAH